MEVTMNNKLKSVDSVYEDIITFNPETLPPILPEHQNHKK